MRLRRSFPSSVTRWLLMVVGCAVLETAQPMKAASDDAVATPRGNDTVIHPGGSGSRSSTSMETAAASVGSTMGGWTFAALVGFGGTGYWWWLRRRQALRISGGGPGLDIEQTRSLGNRQFLVVASCDGRRFLLGVAPGQINRLADLDADSVAEGPRDASP